MGGVIVCDACVVVNSWAKDSPFRQQCRDFLAQAKVRGYQVHVPAHGHFEIMRAARKVEREGRFFGESIEGEWEYPIHLVPLDDAFIQAHVNIELPYAKASDHIYMVYAFRRGYPLVSTDKPLREAANAAGVKAFLPKDFPFV